ncbi:hypothetical protein F2Q70_00025324 [Brassica cretica]|uniref:Uncharacterized protein n=1 Tax=Brassica cretica TaxID=69181 RepID=A0A8S9IJ07_BRACR|nr:hypothetical protein F2Q68_00024722 [Brassica cretica]KAF2601845.1 hypothetical protein F2Q70_00025324 [Brassica cretica]
MVRRLGQPARRFDQEVKRLDQRARRPVNKHGDFNNPKSAPVPVFKSATELRFT